MSKVESVTLDCHNFRLDVTFDKWAVEFDVVMPEGGE
jgi:hypothetical protein